MAAQHGELPLGRVMIGNAFILSIAYLAVGVVVEVLRREVPHRWVSRASAVLDSLPVRVLELVGLLNPVREAYVAQELSGFWLRAIFGMTAVAVIFALALVVGVGTWGAQRAWDARERRRIRR